MPSTDELTGRILTGQRGTYRLDKLLGAGLTARVYSAFARFDAVEEQPVAAKVLRPGLGEEERRRFRAESIHLGALLGYGAAAAPEYFEHFEPSEPDIPEVLVLELMIGREVADLLQEQGRLSEQEGLALGVQLAELLVVLHEKMQQTYTDFKFENLWWEQKKGVLKVTDWNVLSDRGDLSRLHVDLLRASRYIYAVLTGGEARESGGIVTTNFRDHPGWKDLSVGVQATLATALHRNPERRFQTAATLTEALNGLLRFWIEEPKLLLAQLKIQIGDEYQHEKYERALKGLDILRKRDASGQEGFSASDLDALDQLLNKVEGRLSQEESAYERGIHLFRGRSFPEAAVMFTQTQENDPWFLPAWRWREAARAGDVTTNYEVHRQDVERALDALNGGDYARAEEMFREIGVPDLVSVLREAQTRRLVAEAEQLAADGQALIEKGQGDTPEAEKTFGDAQAAFTLAADTLRKIEPGDYRQQLLAELGDLAARGRALADERRAAAAKAGGELRQAEAVYSGGDWAAAHSHLGGGLNAVPDEPRLLETGFRFGRERFLAGDMASAVSFLDLVSKFQPDKHEPRLWWRMAAGVQESVALLDADQWMAALDKAGALIAGPLPGEAQAAVAQSLQSAIDHAAQRPDAAPDFGAIVRLTDLGQRLSSLDPNLKRWADELRAQLPDMLKASLTARHLKWSPERVKAQVEQALMGAEDSYAVARALRAPVNSLMEAVPAAGDLANAQLVLETAELVGNYGRESEGGEWQVRVNAYKTVLEAEKDQRRARALETTQQFLLGLMEGRDRSSLERARRAMAEALLLTPSDSEEYALLLALQAQLEDRWALLYGGADARGRVKAFLAGFDAELGAARNADDLSALGGQLNLMREQATSLQATELIEACAVKENILQTVRGNRPQTEALELEMASIGAQIAQLDQSRDVPGTETVRDERWRKLARTAGAILSLHPHHTDATAATQRYADYTSSLGLADRVQALAQLKQALGQPLHSLEQAKAFHAGGQADQARDLLASLPPDWLDLVEVRALSGEVAAGAAFLGAAEAFKQQKIYDAAGDARLKQMLDMSVPAAYIKRSGLEAVFGRERERILRQIADNKPNAKQTPLLLAQLAAADQYLRHAKTRAAGRQAVSAQQAADTPPFVDQVLKGVSDKRANAAQALEVGLAGLPLIAEPSRLAEDVGQRAKQWFAMHSKARRNRILQIAGGIVGGGLLLAALVALTALVWPGWRTDLKAVSVSATATAQAAAPTPTPVEVTVVVIATDTPLSTATPTVTPTPLPTDTPMPSPTDTPTPEPTSTPPFTDPTRHQGFLDAFPDKALAADSAPITSTITNTFTINNVMAVLDNADPEAGLYRNEMIATDKIIENPQTPGLFGGMSFAKLGGGSPPKNIEELNFRWSLVPALETGDYRLFVFIPNLYGTVNVTYSVESGVNGSFNQLDLNGGESTTIDQNLFNDNWVDLGQFTLDAVADVRVLARPSNGPGSGSTIQAGFDAITIVRMP